MLSMTVKKILFFFLLAAFLLSACGARTDTVPTSTVEPGLPTPAYTSTPLPPRELTVCLGEQPNTLYPFGLPNAAARSVLAAIYDGPIDLLNYEYYPVILEKLPSLSAGDAEIAEVTVGQGDEVIDASGNLVLLEPGTAIRPAGCRTDNCVVVYDGTNPVTMDQMIVNFTLLPNLAWSDGEPLTADDSVYGFEVASEAATPGSKFLVDRTQTYEATDELSTQWWGKPGFIDPTYFTNFWMPLPRHLWGNFSAAELPTLDISSRTPTGWGAYVLESWNGDELLLKRNPFYFRASEGLPKFDTLRFRVVGDPDAAVSDLIEGECDVLDTSIRLEGHVGLLLQMRNANQARTLFGQTPNIEWLAFGITPASYDDGYSPAAPSRDRPNIFGDARVRRAFALCLDRQQVADTVLYGLSVIPNTYMSPDHPLYLDNLPAYSYDVAAGSQLLEQAGWLDHDRNPATLRVAQGIPDVPTGTPLSVTYITTSATQRRQVAEILSASLAQCGIGVTVVNASQVDFYAEGPIGPLFGRQFDLAEYAMAAASAAPQCARFTTAEIPNAGNKWTGTNVGGYKNLEFDDACETARQSLPGDSAYVNSYNKTQTIFADDLPAVPLYVRIEVGAARPDLCGLDLDPTAASDLWSIESFDVGPACGQ